jgi:hypothetical protein
MATMAWVLIVSVLIVVREVRATAAAPAARPAAATA